MQMHAARVNQKEDENEEDLSGTGAGEQKHSIKTRVTHLGAAVNNTQAWNLRQGTLYVLRTTSATKCTRSRYVGLGTKSNASLITFYSLKLAMAGNDPSYDVYLLLQIPLNRSAHDGLLLKALATFTLAPNGAP